MKIMIIFAAIISSIVAALSWNTWQDDRAWHEYAVAHQCVPSPVDTEFWKCALPTSTYLIRK